MTLDEALRKIQVTPPGLEDDPFCPPDWYAVADTNGNIAYFGDEHDALAFRLMLVNMMLNRKEFPD